MDTTTLGFKKPTTSDPSSGLRQAIRDNADLAEALLLATPSWITPTLLGSWNPAVFSSAYPPQYRKVGDTIELRGAAYKTSGAGAATALFNFASGFYRVGAGANVVTLMAGYGTYSGGLSIPAAGALVALSITSNLVVNPIGTASAGIFLDGLTFSL